MSDVKKTVRDVDNQIQQTARKVAQPAWVEPLARFGYAAKGLVYALIGLLAVQAAVGTQSTPDSQSALDVVAQQPFGRLLLGLVAIGLFGYVVWRIVQATLDTENKGTEAGGIANRIGYVISAVTYIGLALAAARIALGTGGGDSSSDMTAQVMGVPFGRFLVGLIGLVVIGVGGYQMYRGGSRGFEKELKHNEMSATAQTWARRSGIVGLLAQGAVFGITGVLLVLAAIRHNPDEEAGLGRALQTLEASPFGPWLLGIIAVGLVAYGIFSLVEARYRRMIVS